MADYSFLTVDMVMSSNLVPSKYMKEDVRLLYSRSNPAHMGFWFSVGNVHERYSLKLIKELGFSGQQVRDMAIAYMTEG